MRSSAGTQSLRHPWIASAVQGWRLESGLGIGTFIVLLIAHLLAPWGPYFVLGVACFVLWQRPDLRQRYGARARARSLARPLEVAMWLCGVVGRDGRIPKVVGVTEIPVGRRFRLELPVGLHLDAMEARAPELAAALDARSLDVRAVKESARFVELIARNAEAFSELMASDLTDRRRNDLWQPITIGSDESGELVSLVLPEHNLLLGGEPGSGKSVALSVLIANAALDPTVSISLLDGKQVELAAWSNIAEHLVGPDQEAAIEVLEALVETMSERYETLLRERRRKIAPDGGFGIHLVVIDELAFYLRGGTKPLRDRFGELLRDLVSRGRAAGIVVIAATQKPSHDIVPTFIRDLFAYRLAMRCSSTDASDTILGSGWAQRECSAASIDPGQRGVGYLLAEGGVPVLIKTPYLDDAEIELIARQSEALRGLR